MSVWNEAAGRESGRERWEMHAVFVGLKGVHDNMCGEELWVCCTGQTAHVLGEYKCTHTE